MNAGIVGRWEIVSWEQRYDDGRRQFPLGEDLTGFISYSADGQMVCLIARGERPNFTTGGQWNANADEKAAAYESMLAYAGTYAIDGDTVTHHVAISLFPNWTGGEQRRRFVFNADGTLALEARLEEGTPHARTAALVWRRTGEVAEGQAHE